MKKILFITALLIGFLGSAQDSIVKAVSLKGRGPFLVKGSITGTTITGAQIVDSLNLELGSTDWQTGGGSSLPVDDTTALVQDPVDNTKTGLIDVGNVPTGTPATLSINGDNSFHDVLTITNTSSTIDPTLIFDKGPTMKDWALYAGSSGLGFYEETDVDSGVFGFTYVLRTGGNPIAGADLVDKTYADALNTDDQTAAEVPNTPSGNISSTNVQAAINELDSEKVANTIAGRTGDAVSAVMIQDEADYIADGDPGTNEIVFCRGCAPMQVGTSATIDIDKYRGYDDRATDAATFTFDNLKAGAAVLIEIDRASDATYSGITIAHTTGAFAANTRQLVTIFILPSGDVLRDYKDLE